MTVRLATLAAAVALAMSACSSAGDEVVATAYNGDLAITRGEVSVVFVGPAVSRAVFGSRLEAAIVDEVLARAMEEDLGLRLDAGEIDATRALLIEQAETSQGRPIEEILSDEGVTAEDLVRQARLITIQTQLIDALGEEWDVWAIAALADAGIQVDPAYGTWVDDPFPQLLPPS